MLSCLVGIDPSKRSTGVVAITSQGTISNFILVCPPKDIDNEELLSYQCASIDSFVSGCGLAVAGVALEGLSFNSVGSGKDILYGVHWAIRMMIHNKYPGIPIGSIPPQSWRSKVISTAERKALSGGKDAIKRATVDKLPFEVKIAFEQYIMDRKLKKEAIYDLADAYYISQYRLSLGI